jgi:hypothetical protein
VSATVRPVGQPTWRCASRHFDRARFSIRQAPEFRPCPSSVHHPGRLVAVRNALRLHEAGLIKSSPQKIVAQGADWRFSSGS